MNDILTAVFGRLRMRLHSGAARMLHSDSEADDVLQDAFERLWKQRSSFKGERHVEGAAVTAVRNICIDELRRRSARPEAELSDAMAATDSDDRAERRQLLDTVNALIASELSSRDRDILVMRDRNGYDFDEIADEFGMTEAAVRVALSRARKTIRNIYRARYGQ